MIALLEEAGDRLPRDIVVNIVGYCEGQEWESIFRQYASMKPWWQRSMERPGKDGRLVVGVPARRRRRILFSQGV